MNTGRPLKVGMVGVGGFGAYRRRKMRETGLFQLISAFDVNPANLASCVDEERCMSAGSLDELLDTPGIEAVVIASGAKYHAEQTLAAMERGLHVFVEKPLCSSAAEVAALKEAQARTGLVVSVGHKDHFASPKSKWLKKMIDEGELGKLATFAAVTAHSGGLVMKPGDWRADPASNPGGMLFQCGVHFFHELAFLFGALRKITCMMDYSIHTTQTADIAQCLLQFESGLVGTLGAYHVTPYHHALTIYGTDQTLFMDERSGDASIYMMQTRNQPSEPRVSINVPEDADDSGNLENFYHSIRDGANPYPGLEDGAMPVLACLAAIESVSTGKAIELDFGQ